MKRHKKFVLCIRNDKAEDLEIRKVYRVLPDVRAAKDGLIRVVDESGEDYLYPADYFVPVELSREAERALSPVARKGKVRARLRKALLEIRRAVRKARLPAHLVNEAVHVSRGFK